MLGLGGLEAPVVPAHRGVLHGPLHGDHQHLPVHRLEEVLVDPEAQGLDGRAHVLALGDDDQRQVRVAIAQGGDEGEAAHAGHHQVGDHRVDAPLVEAGERLLGGSEGLDLEIGAPVEGVGVELPEEPLVVDDHHPHGVPRTKRLSSSSPS